MPRTIKQGIFSAHKDALSTLAAAFPQAVKDGEVDWDALKEILADAPSTGPEKYELTWAGKAEAKREAGRDVVGRTLRFCPEESKDAETTQNLYVEGDNLEVLKLLRENYYGAVKMIYIDPPYNTGNDFVYRDKFSQSEAESELAEGNIDDDGQRLVKNPKSSNRYHANWLSMMYPRLRLSRDLLAANGVIFISIDDEEVSDARKVCDEVFGERNFVAQIPWQSRQSIQNDTDFSINHEYLICYARNRRQEKRRLKENTEKEWHNTDSFVCHPLPMNKDKFSNPDNDPRGPWKADPFDAPNIRANLAYEIENPNTGEIYLPPAGRHWRTEEEKYKEALKENRIIFGMTGSARPLLKVFYEEKKDFGDIDNSWFDGDRIGTTTRATKEIQDIFTGQAPFDTPKPTSLLIKLMELSGVKNDDIVLDFFSGSGSIAHAVMKLNFRDNHKRKFICVQLDEKVKIAKDDDVSLDTIAAIGRERIRRSGEMLYKEWNNESKSLFSKDAFKDDIGFKAFKTADTIIRWTHDALRSGEQTLLDEAAISDKDRLDFMPGFTDIDVVYEIALRQNDVPLSAPVRPVPEAGKRTYLFADSILVCLEDAITPELVEALAAIQPTPNKFILRDSAFEDNIALKDETLRRLQACVARNTKDSKSTYVVDFI